MILSATLFFLAITLANVIFWPKLRKGQAEGDLSILIPARNEESNLPACLESLASQQAREILVYDDHSTDNTAAIASAHLIQTQPLPPGWYGKSFACSQLASAATSPWLLFLDADVRLLPGACARMIAEAQRRRLTMLSCWPGFDTGTFAEAVLMPMLSWIVFSIFPGPLSLFRNERSLALAHGACILVRRDVYERLGGHGAVRNEIFEDTRLAQLWRERGERSLCLDGQDIVRVRMYNGLDEIWQGFQKNFFLAFRHEYNFWIFLALHFTVFVAPFIVLDWRACIAILLARSVLLLRFRQPLWSVAFHPFSELFLIALGIAAWRNRGRVAWKGREYA